MHKLLDHEYKHDEMTKMQKGVSVLCIFLWSNYGGGQ